MPVRVALLAAFLALVPAAPAGAAPKCKRTDAGPPLSARVLVDYASHANEPQRTYVIACDRRTGRRRVLRRAVRRERTGREVTATSAAGRRVAWLEVVIRRSSTVGIVIVADGRTGRRLQRRYIFRGGRFRGGKQLGVALTTRGELAWNTGTRSDDVRVVLAAPEEPLRELDRGSLGAVRVEDDGSLIWRDELGLRTHDLPGRAFGAGCPKLRSRYRPVGSVFGDVVFTEADEREPFPFEGATSLLRACDRRTGIDNIVGAAFSDLYMDSERILPQGGGNGWAAMSLHRGSRYDPCGSVRLSTVEIATRRPGRTATTAGCDGVPLSAETVVTSAGAPAWIAPGEPPSLTTIDAAGEFAELDRGAIADVATDGEDVVWTNAGERRRARP